MAEIKRLNYFTNQFLVEADFKDEQAYHLGMRRLHNKLLHTPGVAEGLLVTGAVNTNKVTVDLGTALDAQGREIVLAEPQSITLPVGPTKAEVYIAYDQKPSDPSTIKGAEGNTRITEKPILSMRRTLPAPADPVPADGVLLAEVTLNNGQLAAAPNNPNNDVRKRAGAVFGSQWDDVTGGINYGKGNVGIGTTNPEVALHVRQDVVIKSFTGDNNQRLRISAKYVDGEYVLLGFEGVIEETPEVTPKNFAQIGAKMTGGGSFLTFGTSRDYRLGITNEAMTINPIGNVGIGTTTPAEPLEVNGRIKSGALTMGPWPANPTQYVFFGTNALDQANVGNYALLQGIAAEKGVTFLNSPERINFRIANADKMVLTKDGNVGIGTANPRHRLHVAAGSYIQVDGAANEQCYIGADGAGNDVQLGSFNPNIANVSVWNEATKTNMNLFAREFIGTLRGPKIGYVVDHFVNRLGEPLEEGDVVVIGENQASLYYGAKSDVPIPEVDLTKTAYNSRVCGIVCEVYAELKPVSSDAAKSESNRSTMTEVKATSKRGKPEIFQLRSFSPDELAKLDRTKVEPGQIGCMVTLGAYAHCKVDADIAPIEVGDLLTTSPTKGHAQKVLDPGKAAGAIIGKAIGALKNGKGKIPVMVMMQ